MYRNIDPIEGIETIHKYVDRYLSEYNGFFPAPIIIKLLKLGMTYNVFKFGDTWWKQIVGTAMVTSCVCDYATIFFVWFERTDILPIFNCYILLYLRFIDDIILFWQDIPYKPSKFEDFKKSLNRQSKLKRMKNFQLKWILLI